MPSRWPSALGAGLTLLAALCALALLGPLLYRVDPLQQHLSQALSGPSLDTLFGRDALGRDLLSRVLVGARISLTVGLLAISIAALIGTGIGALAGTAGGRVDAVLMRATDIVLAFPGLLLAIALAAALGPSLGHVVLALALTGWTGYARLVRAEVLSLRERDFVAAANALGATPARVVLRHALPQLIGPLAVQAVFGMSSAIVAEASLSFLGLGVQPPTASWGTMINEARAFLLVAPHLAVAPGLAMTLTLLGLVLTGEGLRESADVQSRS